MKHGHGQVARFTRVYMDQYHTVVRVDSVNLTVVSRRKKSPDRAATSIAVLTVLAISSELPGVEAGQTEPFAAKLMID